MNQSQSMAGLASLVQSRGRNGDSMLVHMTPGEVHGLQRLALAHGGSLTVNPDTGLVEANFLKKLLPTLLGVGLNFLVPGLGALGSGLLVGGVEAARTGDIGKGLMAGLGAYGGAGLGSAFSGAGSVAASAAGTPGIANMTPQAFSQALSKEAVAKAAEAGTTKAGLSAGMEALKAAPMTTLKAVGTQLGTPGIAGLGMTAANAMTPDYKMPTGGDMDVDQSYYEGGDYDPVTGTFRQGRWRKGYPGFPGGMAAGGVIPPPNPNYPLSRPSENVGAYESDIDTYTGEERFAAGGAAFGRRRYEEMPIDPALNQPNSAKAGWMEYMQNNPAEQQRFIDAGYPAEFFQQNPATFTGNRPFVPGKDEEVRASEQARLAQAGFSPSTMPQYQSAPQSADSFSSYLQNLNQFITSPIAPPPKPAAPPPASVAPPGAGGRPVAGGGYRSDGAMRWDANQGRFVSSAPQTPFSGGNMPTGNPFTGFSGIDFSAIQNMINAGGGAYAGGSPDFDRYGGQDNFTTPDFSGMDFSGLQNINMSGIGGGGSYMPDMQLPSMEVLPQDTIFSTMPVRDREPSYQQPEDSMVPVAPPDYMREPLSDSWGYRGDLPPIPQGYDFVPPSEPIVYDNTPRDVVYDQLGQPGYYNEPPKISDERMRLAEQYGYTTPFSGSAIDALNVAPPTQVFDSTPEPSYTPPEQSYMAIPEFGQGPAMTYGEAAMANNPQPQPAPDMSGLAGLANYGNYQQPTFSMDNGFSDMGMFAGGGSVQYAAAGKLLRGPGDGMSDSIKANISGKQEARLADGEFVIPADVVSHLGNGSTEAGSRKLYKMMADVRRARTGKRKQAPAIKAGKYVPK